MKSSTELKARIDNLPDGELLPEIIQVLSWKVYPARVEDTYRQAAALDYMRHLQGPDAAAWYQPARDWLHSLCDKYPTWGGTNEA